MELTDTPREVGSCAGDATGETIEDSDRVVILTFSSLDSARVLQDVLGEMIGKWSRDLAPVNKEQS